MREYFDKAYTGRKNTELLRDQMMEDYMIKKRMKRKLRNDHEEHEEFESYVIAAPSEVGVSKKSLLLGLIGLLAGFCYFNRRKGGKNHILLKSDNEYYNYGNNTKRR
jgi:hypothetical protein